MNRKNAGKTQETQLKRYTTYQTTLTNVDILRIFVNEVRVHLQQYNKDRCYYLVGFDVSQNKDEQNCAWTTSVDEYIYQFGTVYSITLWVTNAKLWIRFSNTSFSTDGQSAFEIATTSAELPGGREIREYIISMAASMFNESEMALKMHKKIYSDRLKTSFVSNIMKIGS
jgi:hypothetical protein